MSTIAGIAVLVAVFAAFVAGVKVGAARIRVGLVRQMCAVAATHLTRDELVVFNHLLVKVRTGLEQQT